MQYCPKCKVSVAGTQEVCPLCQGDLRGCPDEKNIFPDLAERPDRKTGFIFRLMLFIAITAAVVCVAINIMVPTSAWWSLFVVFGIGSACISVGVGYLKKSDIMKNIVWQLCIMLVLAVIWDVVLGWHGWSIDYVFPILCVVAIASMFVVGKVMNIPINDYIIYIIVDAVLGIIPIIFLCTGVLHLIYPSVICVMSSVVYIVGLILFKGQNLLDAITRKLHL